MPTCGGLHRQSPQGGLRGQPLAGLGLYVRANLVLPSGLVTSVFQAHCLLELGL